ncbi:hypothetical protein CRE_17154 [Caenorhabditis remanei]|uniref:Uncharacterized protein n=2 Tax=Caenorhabditis remanei TaxID=31234 RepID=E3MAF1_CAERE|nr:hypothetical protein CRE_17154 [Caenorhabditis remanei]
MNEPNRNYTIEREKIPVKLNYTKFDKDLQDHVVKHYDIEIWHIKKTPLAVALNTVGSAVVQQTEFLVLVIGNDVYYREVQSQKPQMRRTRRPGIPEEIRRQGIDVTIQQESFWQFLRRGYHSIF